MKKFYVIAGALLFVVLLAILLQTASPQVQESITFFPIDPNVKFKSAETSLKQTESTLQWRIESTIDRKAYLRQDAGLLFANGKLIAELHGWQQNTDHLRQEKQLKLISNTLYEAIGFHHAELHEKGGRIFSSQTMSGDRLYVIPSVDNSFDSFHVPKTVEQDKHSQALDIQTEHMLQLSWNKGARRFSIPLNKYLAYPLNVFNHQVKKGLPGFTETESNRVAGNLWEGLYKNYLLGIKKPDGSSISPIGSTIPLILIAKDKTHLLVLSEAANGEPILLRQIIENID